ncbi:MAG TPA: hypothetical protein VF595_05625 [Tepidisphaeraceae bacterium]|jgi:hypothetical protein
MNKPILTLLAGLTLSSVAYAQRSNDFDEQYRVLSERNMFLRERRAPRRNEPNRDTRPTVDTTPAGVARAYVLRGVAIEDDELHAYLENTRNSEITRVAPGDALSGGRVVQIVIDAIAFEFEGKTAWVEIGQNMFGSRVAAGPTQGRGEGRQDNDRQGNAPAADGVPTLPSGGPLPPGGGTLEERMKARRAQQRGGK